jgi:tetratricopeptide (TPR) repeat protein
LSTVSPPLSEYRISTPVTKTKTNHSTTIQEYRENNDNDTDDTNIISKLSLIKSTSQDIESEDTIKQEIKKAFDQEKIANALFKQCKFNEARINYQKALDILQVNSKYSNLINQNNFIIIITKCMADVAICNYKLKEYENAINMSNEVIYFI